MRKRITVIDFSKEKQKDVIIVVSNDEAIADHIETGSEIGEKVLVIVVGDLARLHKRIKDQLTFSGILTHNGNISIAHIGDLNVQSMNIEVKRGTEKTPVVFYGAKNTTHCKEIIKNLSKQTRLDKVFSI